MKESLQQVYVLAIGIPEIFLAHQKYSKNGDFYWNLPIQVQ